MEEKGVVYLDEVVGALPEEADLPYTAGHTDVELRSQAVVVFTRRGKDGKRAGRRHAADFFDGVEKDLLLVFELGRISDVGPRRAGALFFASARRVAAVCRGSEDLY